MVTPFDILSLDSFEYDRHGSINFCRVYPPLSRSFSHSTHSANCTVMLGETLSRKDIIGGALIVLGCLNNEIDILRFFRNKIAAFKGLGKSTGTGKGGASGAAAAATDGGA